VGLVDAQDRHELLAQGALDRGQARVSLCETREPLDALQEPLHVVEFAPFAGALTAQVIRA
jgi:hypothetical protein